MGIVCQLVSNELIVRGEYINALKNGESFVFPFAMLDLKKKQYVMINTTQTWSNCNCR